MPGENVSRKKAVRLPSEFFRNGWHLVLTDLEIVTLLAIIDRTGFLRRAPRSGKLRDEGIDLKEAIRNEFYGLSGEAYSTIHALDQFGLIDVKDPMPNRNNPKKAPVPLTQSSAVSMEDPNERVPWRLIYPSAAAGSTPFSDNAYDTVIDRLAM